MKNFTRSMETQISSLLPSGPISVPPDFPAPLEISESPRRETQGNVWPSSAGLGFSRQADLKGFLSEFPRLLRQSGAETALGPMRESTPGLEQAGGVGGGGDEGGSKGQRWPTAEFWAAALKPARPGPS